MARQTDPFTSFRYILEINGIQTAGFQEISGLTNETAVVPWEEGGENTYVHQFRGQTKYTNLTLKHGVSLLSPALWAWREALIHRRIPPLVDITLIMLDDKGEEFARWFFRGCWPAKWIGPDMKGGASELAIETLEIAYAAFGPFEEPPQPPYPKPPEPTLKVRLTPERNSAEKGKSMSFQCVHAMGDPPNHWEWTVDGQAVTGQESMSHTFSKVGEFPVSVKARNAKGEEDEGKGIAQVLPGPFAVSIDPAQKTCKIDEKVSFTCVDAQGEPAKHFKWTLPGGAPAVGKTVEETFKKEGTFTVAVQATNEFGQEARAQAEVKVEKKETPEVKLSCIGPGAQQDGNTWVYYHHAMFYFQLELKCVDKVQLSISGSGGASPYITGYWKQHEAGSVAAKGNQFDAGSPGRIEQPGTHDGRCYYRKTVGPHPDTSIYDLIDGRPKVYNLGASQRWVFAIYSRCAGTWTLTAKGVPPFPCTKDTPNVQAAAQWTMTIHPHPGD